MTAFRYALTTMHISQTQMLIRGELFVADHPLVLAHPDWFGDPIEIAHRAPEVPEVVKRGPGRPRRIETTEAHYEVTP